MYSARKGSNLEICIIDSKNGNRFNLKQMY